MANSWEVTGQTADQFQFDGAGNPVQGYRVSFRTGNGQRGAVFIPDDQYNAENVKKLIVAAAERLDTVAALSGTY